MWWKKYGGASILCLVQHRAGRLGDSDAILDAAGGEGGHGAAKPDGVIHRYVSNRIEGPPEKILCPNTSLFRQCSKHGVMGLMRTLHKMIHQRDGTRINAL